VELPSQIPLLAQLTRQGDNCSDSLCLSPSSAADRDETKAGGSAA
jgi:hypothetical protein